EKFRKKKGVFVTLKIGGELRGCIGYIFAESPLLEAVRSNAVSAATKDPRFRPVSTVELPLLEYEISVLSPLTLIENTDDIEVGKHGLLMVSSPRSGLLLPQVPVELGWNRQQFLEGTCQKAGLPKDAWKDPNILIFTFSAEVFGEKDK
ncbi:MAG: AmmeMemoRadiSam system protein A, partial [bacterium]|nr:AmmeMemoRadiSam system protein A [bacterium]